MNINNKNTAQKPLWQRYQEGDKTVTLGLLTELNKTMDQAINQYAAGDMAYKTQARLLTLKAVESYNPESGATLTTHVYNNLHRLQRLAAQRGNLTHISEGAATQRAAIARARRDWEIDHGEEPTVEELATMTGISRKRIDNLARYQTITPDSMTTSPEGDNLAAVDTDRALDLYDSCIYNELDRIDKKIYEWSTGYGGSAILQQNEMARKLGISPAAVNKRARNISIKFNSDRELVRRAIANGR